MQSETLSKLAATLEKFKPYLYRAEQYLTGLEWSPEPPVGCRPDALEGYGGWRPIEPEGFWGKSDTVGWFRATLEIPPGWAGEKVVLRLRFGPYFDISEPEALVYLNGREAQGLDKFHDRILLSGDARAGETYRMAAEVYSGIKNNRPMLVEASLAIVNQVAEDFYFNLQAGVQAAGVIAPSDLLHYELLKLMNEAYRLVDLSMPGCDSFNVSLAEANQHLEQGFKQLLVNTPLQRSKNVITGHSHIDLAWLWPLWQTRRKAARTFSTVLKLMEEYPGYHFTQSQPQLYRFVKEDQPDLYRRIQARAAEGRWEPLGAMWVESDCNLTGGESLVRQFLYGQRFLEREFGRRSTVLWLPDAFGFTPALPQLMLGSGVNYFMTTKLSWNQSNRFPSDTFHWEGLDGSAVLAHFVTTPSPEDTWQTYNGSFSAEEVAGLWRVYRQKELNSELLYLYGAGDGGGGPTYDMLERAERWQDFPGMPRCEQGSAEAFFERLSERVEGGPAAYPKLPRYYGELYLEFHQGTFTSQGWLKQANRRNEFLLREAELYASWATLGSEQARPPAALTTFSGLEEAWEKLLLNQFHDILPGSSIGAVYEDARRDHTFISETASRVRDEALQYLVEAIPGEGWAVFNGLGWRVTGPVLLPGSGVVPPGALMYQAGSGQSQPLLTQPVQDGTLVAGLSLPPFGYGVVTTAGKSDKKPESPPLEVTLEPPRLENAILRVEFDRNGEISTIFDKEAGREVITPGLTANRLTAYEDRPRRFTAWNIEPYYREKATPLLSINRLQVLEEGPVRATLEIERAYLNSTITQRVSLWADSRRLDFATRLDWHDHQILLKAAFPLDIHATEAVCEVAFGNYARPTHASTPWEQARYEVCAHKWVDLSEGDYGVSLLNDGKYGHSFDQNVLSLTLLKSPAAPDPQADQGRHEFTYSLYPHSGDWRKAQTVRQAYQLNTRATARALPGKGVKAEGANLFSLLRNERDGVVVDTLKPAEDGDGLIVRLYECHNERGPERIHLAYPPKEVWECNLLEDRLHPISTDGNTFSFSVRPYEVKTFRLIF